MNLEQVGDLDWCCTIGKSGAGCQTVKTECTAPPCPACLYRVYILHDKFLLECVDSAYQFSEPRAFAQACVNHKRRQENILRSGAPQTNYRPNLKNQG